MRPRLIPSDPGSSRLPRLFPVLLAAVAVALLVTPGWAQEQKEAAYRAFPYVGSRLAVWVIAQIHLNFAAFILGVPIFAVIIEFMGWRIGMDREEGRRYDWLSHEFVKLTFAAFSTTALLGGLLLFLLITLYPRFWTYMSGIFAPTMWLYAVLFFLETFTVYLWYYGWDWLSGPRKGIHVALGVLSNLFGTAILFVSNSWVTFMISPAGVDDAGKFTGTLWQAVEQLHLDADQHPPAHRQRRLRRHDRRRLRGLPLPRRQDRRGARPLRLDGLHRELRGALGADRPAVRRLLARAARSTRSTRRWASR